MNIDTKALIAATPATVALVRRELDKSRESQRGMQCGTPKAVKVDCAMVERLCRIAEKQAYLLAALEAENSRLQAGIQLYKADFEYGLNGLKHEYAKLKQDNARLRGQISAMLGELEDFAMQNDLPIEDGHGYFGTGLPLRALQEWLFKQKDALAAGGE